MDELFEYIKPIALRQDLTSKVDDTYRTYIKVSLIHKFEQAIECDITRCGFYNEIVNRVNTYIDLYLDIYLNGALDDLLMYYNSLKGY